MVEVQAPQQVKVQQPVMPRVDVQQEALETPAYEMETVAAVKHENEDSTERKVKKSFFDKYIDRIKEFLDNAE